MDAGGLLSSQGWRGHGHTLHATDDSTGLARPLLLARKDNRLGIGSKEHGATSDQWWLNAFDQQLKGLDTSRPDVVVVQTVRRGALNAAASGPGSRYGGAVGLYASFVSGGMLQGTIREDSPAADTASTPEADGPGPRKETREERRARREARRSRKADKVARRLAAETETTRTKSRSGEPPDERQEAKKKRREERRHNGDAG